MPEQDPTRASRLIVGRWEVDVASGEAASGAETVRLEPRMLEVLVALATRSGQVVPKEDLRDQAWAGVHVSDDAVWRCLAKLRKCLADRDGGGELIETLPRRGYRLNAEVRWEYPGQAAGSASEPGRRPRILRLSLAAALTAVAALAAYGVSDRDRARNAQPVAVGDPRDWTADELYATGAEHYARLDREDVLRAAEYFEQALQIDAEHAPALAGLAIALRFRAVYFYDGSELLSEARSYAERAVALAPELPEAHKAMGLIHGAAGELEQEIASYERALELKPGYVTVSDNLAVAYMHRGRIRDALDIMLEVKPSRVEQSVHYANVGYMFAMLGDLRQAQDFYQAAIAADPLMAAPTAGLVRLELSRGRPDAARSWIDESLADPDSIPMLNARADVAIAGGDFASARALLESSIASAAPGRNYDARTRLIFVLNEVSEGPSQDLQEHESWLRMSGDGDTTWRHAQSLAGVLVVAGEYDHALSVLERAAAYGHLEEPWLRVDPLFGPLHGAHRFEALLEGIAARSAADIAALRRNHGDLSGAAS